MNYRWSESVSGVSTNGAYFKKNNVTFLRKLLTRIWQEIQNITRMLLITRTKRIGVIGMTTAQATQQNLIYFPAEQQYHKYFETLRTGIIYLDNNSQINNMNKEAERICGIDRIKVLGKKPDSVFFNFGEKFLKAFHLSEYDDYYTTAMKLNVKDKVLYVHVDSLKMRSLSGELCGLLLIIQDVSDVYVAIKQIETTQLLMSLGELAAGVAHHVRSPLTTISGYLQVMLGRIENDQYTVRRDILEMLLDEVGYINKVVKELIMFAKPPVQKNTGVQVNRLLEQALLLTFKELGGEHIAIRKTLDENLPEIIADANLLKQAFVNVMSNAIEAMGTIGTILVKTWVHTEQHMLVVAISDTGQGIGPDLMARIFEPFYTTKLDRMGLGLPIANRIIAEHGGFTNIISDENGTRVHIYLPLADENKRRLAVMHQQVLNLQ